MCLVWYSVFLVSLILRLMCEMVMLDQVRITELWKITLCSVNG
jgi:hypothetical protein